MIVFVLRAGSHDTGSAFPNFKDAAGAAADLEYAEIVRANLPQQGAELYCALFNRELGDDARIVAVVHGGKVLVLNQKLSLQQVYACPHGHTRGVIAPANATLLCGTCGQPLIAG